MTRSLDQLLRHTVEQGGSDLHLKADSPPLMRLHGELLTLDGPPLTSDEVYELARSILSPAQMEAFDAEMELDFAHQIEGVARFRGNMLLQRGRYGVIFRVIPLKIQTMEELNLPPVCKWFAERPRGLVLVTGPAGSGKSTTQAAMINHINQTSACHIVTVEDPIEFKHEDVKALINQRELGRDTNSFANALKFVLRQDPDVILIGEMRDLETIQLAITAAETGHLVFGTLHTTDAVQTIDRIIDVFPMHQQQQVRMQLAVNLIGVVSQTLLRRKDGQGRVAAFETLVAIPAIRNLIRENKTFQLTSLIQTGSRQGMITLDQYMMRLVNEGAVDYDTAVGKATDPNEFAHLFDQAKQEAAAHHRPAPGGAQPAMAAR